MLGSIKQAPVVPIKTDEHTFLCRIAIMQQLPTKLENWKTIIKSCQSLVCNGT